MGDTSQVGYGTITLQSGSHFRKVDPETAEGP